MDTDYADAVVFLHEAVTRALAEAEAHRLTRKEQIEELRRIADDIEKEF